jgi:hypothetical protein
MIKNVPDDITKADLTAKLARNGYDVSKLGGVSDKWVPDSVPVEQQPKDERGLLQKAVGKVTGDIEGAGTLLTGATTGLLGRIGGTLGGIAGSIATGKFGTQEGAAMAAQTAEESARKFTYEPKTKEGKEALETIGRVFDESKLAGLGPVEAVAAPRVISAEASQAARQMAGKTVSDVRQGARDLRANVAAGEPQMAGMGSASTAPEAMRRQRAADLPVPIDLTKGQASRDFAQQQFEREAAKNPDIGNPLRQRFSDQNQKILQNFDAWVDQTGAEGGSLRAVGQTVTDAIVNKSNKAKAEIRYAYEKAKESGAMQEKVDLAPLTKYLEDHQAEAINAQVLTSVEKRLGYVEKDGQATINDLEEVRKMAGRLSGKDATNSIFANEVKKVIDEMTDGKGGDLYKRARSLRFRYGQEFQDHAVIDKMLSFKPGTKDRSVAYEDVFSHSILNGSLDDVRTVRKTLQTAGKEGEQAWKELQGATIQHIKDEITKNVQIDQAGNRVISPAKLDRMVSELDKDGKLDFIFGKQGAQQIRDVNGIAQDAFTAPPGAVNHSNTASVLVQALDKVSGKVTGIPFVGSAINYAAKEMKNAGDRKKVKSALEK